MSDRATLKVKQAGSGLLLVLLSVFGVASGSRSCANIPLPLAFAASTAPSASYFVDSVSGNDSNSGTSPGSAWMTLERVNATTFSPGDRILFKSGSSWVGQLWPKGSGTELHPIVVSKYGGQAKPVINGAGQADAALLLKNQQFWEVSDLDVTNTGPSVAVRRGVRIVAENYGEMRHIYVRDLTVHDVNGSDSDDAKENGGITYSCIGDTRPSRLRDLRIENNRIYQVDRSGIFGWSTHWVRSRWYPSLGVVIRNNVLSDIGGDGIVAVATDGALVEYNVVRRANQRSQGYNAGIWPWSADNTVVQFNEVYGTRGQRDGEGFDADWNSRNTIIQYNYSHDNDGGFLLICNDGSQSPQDSAGNTGTIVRYNISQNDHTRGINIAGPISNTLIYNNTIFVGRNERVDALLASDWHGWPNGVSVYNNIFYVLGSAQFSYGMSRRADGAYVTALGLGPSTNVVLDFNSYFGISAFGDKHAQTVDPKLVDPGHASVGRDTASGYQLQSGSPVADSGRDVENNGGRDFFGAPVPSCDGTDRGAAESSACPALGAHQK